MLTEYSVGTLKDGIAIDIYRTLFSFTHLPADAIKLNAFFIFFIFFLFFNLVNFLTGHGLRSRIKRKINDSKE